MQIIRQFFNSHPWVMIYMGAELLCILAKSQDITNALKRKSQRTAAEQKKIERGLKRSILLELLVYVPISATLVLLGIAPMLEVLALKFSVLQNMITFNSLMGIASYGFPFASLRAVITKIALRTLSKYALLAHKAIEGQLEEKLESSKG